MVGNRMKYNLPMLKMRKSNQFCYHIRIIILICMVTLLTVDVQAQDKNNGITINLRNATLEEFTKKIEEITEYSFIYGEEVKTERRISINVKSKTVEEILKLVFVDEPIEYKISGKHILLHKASPKPVVRKHTISGYVTDKVSSETLIGANVYDNRKYQGTTTNSYGHYTITLPEGETELSFSYLGYVPQKHHFNLKKDTVLNIMMETNNMLEEVVVYSDKVESGLRATHTGAIDIPMAQIRNTPVILGEADVMKTIQSMPGVQAGVEGSAGLFVRGGSPDQNLILLDGIPIYNVDHLLGFFSVFTPEAMKKVTLFKSSFPARFGGRLSSVIDVRTNDGDMNNYHGVVSVGLLATRVNFEGPIVKDKTSFNVSLRRTYLDLFTKPFMDDDSKVGYYFYDINAKINHKFSDKNRLFLSVYHGNDYLSSEYTDEWGSEGSKTLSNDKTNGRWGNTIASARLNTIINNQIFNNTTVAFNQYKLNMNAKSYTQYKNEKNNYHTNYNSGIRDLSIQTDFDYNPLPKHHIKFGGGYIYHNFKPEVMTSRISSLSGYQTNDTLYNAKSNSQIHAHEISLYGEDEIQLTSRLRTNVGVHASGFHVQGKTYFSIQPRVAARYQLKPDVVIKASYSKMSQYINLLTSAPISMPTDLWVPVTKKIKPMNAHQYSLGGYYTGFKGWEFSAEAYYKEMNNILEYKDGTYMMGSSTSWEDKVEVGKGRSFGIELMAQKTIGKTTGWISYTLSKSDRKFADGTINNGERFPFKYDRRHSVDLIINHKFNERIDIGASWTFMSGARATISKEVIAILIPEDDYWHNVGEMGGHSHIKYEDYVEGRNNYKLPASHRLNVGINFHKKTKNGIRTWNFSIYNVYNAMNPTFVTRKVRAGEIYNGYENRNLVPVIKKFTLLPLVPAVTYTYKF